MKKIKYVVLCIVYMVAMFALFHFAYKQVEIVLSFLLSILASFFASMAISVLTLAMAATVGGAECRNVWTVALLCCVGVVAVLAMLKITGLNMMHGTKYLIPPFVATTLLYAWHRSKKIEKKKKQSDTKKIDRSKK